MRDKRIKDPVGGDRTPSACPTSAEIQVNAALANEEMTEEELRAI